VVYNLKQALATGSEEHNILKQHLEQHLYN